MIRIRFGIYYINNGIATFQNRKGYVNATSTRRPILHLTDELMKKKQRSNQPTNSHAALSKWKAK